MDELKKKMPLMENAEAIVLNALDKGIDDWENGRTIAHEQAIKTVRRNIKEHVLLSKQ